MSIAVTNPIEKIIKRTPALKVNIEAAEEIARQLDYEIWVES